MAYTKLSHSILTSTIWVEDDPTRIAWVTLLALANRHGEVSGSVPGLASVARIPVERCREAIEKFLAPDPDSRTQDDAGRRIERIDGGWQILNYAKYRDLASDEDRKRQAAVRQQRARDRRKRNGVTLASRQKTQAEAEADIDPDLQVQADPVVAAVPAAARQQAVQGTGAFEPGSLHRDHLKHAVCGPRYLICLSPKQYANLAPRYHGTSDDDTRVALKVFLGSVEATIDSEHSPGDFIWLLQHFDAWLVAQGRVTAAPTGKPKPRTVEEIKASMRAKGML